MNITLIYETQLKRAVGMATEILDVADDADATDAVRAAAQRHGEAVRAMLLTAEGQVRPSVLMFLGDQQVSRQTSQPLTEGDTLTLTSPISGG